MKKELKKLEEKHKYNFKNIKLRGSKVIVKVIENLTN